MPRVLSTTGSPTVINNVSYGNKRGTTYQWTSTTGGSIEFDIPGAVRYLIVGGGAAGSGLDAGIGSGEPGGGGGGVLSGGFLTTTSSYAITVGEGSSALLAYPTEANPTPNGGDSSIVGTNAPVTPAYGGGRGGFYGNSDWIPGATGGSGGGAAWGDTDGAGAGTAGQGFRGGNAGGDLGAPGGGGASEAAPDVPPGTYQGGDGGEGLTNTITGVSQVYGSGGAGGGDHHTEFHALSYGGTNAGNGAYGATTQPATSAIDGFGGGGGGGNGSFQGGDGGDGTVAIFVPNASFTDSVVISNIESSTKTFTGINVGAGFANRWILLVVTGYNFGTEATSFGTVTIGNETATLVYSEFIGELIVAHFLASVPTGSSIEAVVNTSGRTYLSNVATYIFNGQPTLHDSATVSHTSGNPGAIALSVDVPANGTVVSTAYWEGPYNSASWDNLDIDILQTTGPNLIVASACGLDAEVGRTSTITHDFSWDYPRITSVASYSVANEQYPEPVPNTLVWRDFGQVGNNTGNENVQTFTGAEIGPASADRWVIVGVKVANFTATSIASLAVATLPASLLYSTGSIETGDQVQFYKVNVPTGTTADITITYTPEGDGAYHVNFAVWTVEGEPIFHDGGHDTVDTSGELSTVVDIPANGYLVAMSRRPMSSSASWSTGLTADNFDDTYDIALASAGLLAQETDRLITVNYPDGFNFENVLGVVSFSVGAAPPASITADLAITESTSDTTALLSISRITSSLTVAETLLDSVSFLATSRVTSDLGLTEGTNDSLSIALGTIANIPDPVVVEAHNGRTGTVNTVTHNINLPTGSVAGDLILVIFSCDGGVTHTINTSVSGNNWNSLGRIANGTTVASSVYWKISEGAASDNLTITTSGSEQSSHLSYRIQNADTVEGSSATGSSTNGNPPLHTIASGPRNTLWFASLTTDSTVVATAAPSLFGNLHTIAAAGTGGASTSSARYFVEADAEIDPGTFTSGNEQWIARTIAVYHSQATVVESLTASFVITEVGSDSLLVGSTSKVTNTVAVLEDTDIFAGVSTSRVIADLASTESLDDSFSISATVQTTTSLSITEVGEDSFSIQTGQATALLDLGIIESTADSLSATSSVKVTGDLTLPDSTDSFSITTTLKVTTSLLITEAGSDSLSIQTAGSAAFIQLAIAETTADSLAVITNSLITANLETVESTTDELAAVATSKVLASATIVETLTDTLSVTSSSKVITFFNLEEPSADSLLLSTTVLVTANFVTQELGSDTFAMTIEEGGEGVVIGIVEGESDTISVQATSIVRGSFTIEELGPDLTQVLSATRITGSFVVTETNQDVLVYSVRLPLVLVTTISESGSDTTTIQGDLVITGSIAVDESTPDVVQLVATIAGDYIARTKVWNGTQWAFATPRVWTGTQWERKPLRWWGGQSWNN